MPWRSGGIADRLGDALEGMGPEVFNAGVLLTAVAMLAWNHIWMQRHGAALAGQIKRVGVDIRSGARPLGALAGYDDRPSAMQLLFFSITFAGILTASRRVNGRGPQRARAEATHKIYSPIVEEGKVALEMRGHRAADGDPAVDRAQAHKLDSEYAPTRFWLTELVGEWEKEPGESLQATEVAWEDVFQFFEQGRYAVDAGLLVEYAHSLEDGAADKLELGALLQKGFSAKLTTFNLIAAGDLAGDADTELEYALQYRWRRGPRFEPGVELHGEFGEFGHFGSLGEHRHETGPAIFGKFHFGRGALRYEGAWLFGLTDGAPAQTLRFLLEYEF